MKDFIRNYQVSVGVESVLISADNIAQAKSLASSWKKNNKYKGQLKVVLITMTRVHDGRVFTVESKIRLKK